MLAPAAKGGQLIYARVVIDQENASCPTLKGDGNTSIATQRRPMYPTPVTTELEFPVTVCEAVIEPDTAYSNPALNIQLDAVTLRPEAIQIYGDSGCKPDKPCTGDEPSPQFQALTNVGAGKDVDLILHMGDYNYRGTSGHLGVIEGKDDQPKKVWAYDAGDGVTGDPQCGLTSTYYSQNSTNSPHPNTWASWQSDFFTAAQNLLGKAPWVFARGNHELCSRAGPGWFYFMGPGSSLAGGIPQMQCPDQGDFNNPPALAKNHIAMIPPYMLDLASLQLWVMDSANACDEYGVNTLTADYSQQYQQLENHAPDLPVWIMTHRPIWGFQKTSSPTLNQMLQAALANSPAKKLPASVELVLAGHMHIYESLSFLGDGSRPPQIVVGNSGVSLSSSPDVPSFSASVDGAVSSGNAMQEFGFLQINVADDGSWTGNMLGTNGNSQLSCDSSNLSRKETICKSVYGP